MINIELVYWKHDSISVLFSVQGFCAAFLQHFYLFHACEISKPSDNLFKLNMFPDELIQLVKELVTHGNIQGSPHFFFSFKKLTCSDIVVV